MYDYEGNEGNGEIMIMVIKTMKMMMVIMITVILRLILEVMGRWHINKFDEKDNETIIIITVKYQCLFF